jgi:hypothetical protein
MKKRNVKRLALERETIRTLNDSVLPEAAGGNTTECPSLFPRPGTCGPFPQTHPATE